MGEVRERVCLTIPSNYETVQSSPLVYQYHVSAYNCTSLNIVHMTLCKGLNNSDSSITFSLNVIEYPPRLYTIIVNVTDVYGQTASMSFGLYLLGMLR